MWIWVIVCGVFVCFVYFFFFKQKTAYEMRISDWSSDVCSSDLIIAEELRTDTDQQAAAQRLDALQKELEAAPPRGSTLWKMLRRAPPPPRGLYMWGGVGRGKSMLMDLFFDSLDIRRKRRV